MLKFNIQLNFWRSQWVCYKITPLVEAASAVLLFGSGNLNVLKSNVNSPVSNGWPHTGPMYEVDLPDFKTCLVANGWSSTWVTYQTLKTVRSQTMDTIYLTIRPARSQTLHGNYPAIQNKIKLNRDLIKNKTKMVRAMEPGSDNGTHVQIQGKGLFKRLATLVPLLTT